MHSSSLRNLERFYKTYLQNFDNPNILDIGGTKLSDHMTGLDVIRKINGNFNYKTIDIKDDPSVDIVLKNPYSFDEIKENSIDIAVSISTFEHVEFFWLTYLQILRVLKPHGIFYMNAPSNGIFHRWDQDCWRFYPDSGIALKNWGKHNNYNNSLLESFTTKKYLEGGWNDYNVVFLKDKKYISKYPSRIIDKINDFYNGIKNDDFENLINRQQKTEDHENYGYKLWYKLNKKIQKYRLKLKLK